MHNVQFCAYAALVDKHWQTQELQSQADTDGVGLCRNSCNSSDFKVGIEQDG